MCIQLSEVFVRNLNTHDLPPIGPDHQVAISVWGEGVRNTMNGQPVDLTIVQPYPLIPGVPGLLVHGVEVGHGRMISSPTPLEGRTVAWIQARARNVRIIHRGRAEIRDTRTMGWPFGPNDIVFGRRFSSEWFAAAMEHGSYGRPASLEMQTRPTSVEMQTLELIDFWEMARSGMPVATL